MSPSVYIAAAAAACMLASAQDVNDEKLARLLANKDTRRGAVIAILTSTSDRVPLLLSWTQKAPAHIDRAQLYVGLADAFGQLRTKEAIPFLIKYIDLERSMPRPNIWLKNEVAIAKELPAVGALIRIGPPASKALIETPLAQLPPGERLATIFTVARIGDPAARGFLSSALGGPRYERYWAEECLKRLDGNSSARQW